MVRVWTSLIRRTSLLENRLCDYGMKRGLSATVSQLKKKMPDRPKPPPEKEFTEVFLHGSGPGGQKIVCIPNYPSYI